MKILVVDDSALDRKLMMRTLQKADITNEILQAEDGLKALEMIGEHYKDICVVLLDWQMPNMSGLEVLAGVAKIPELSKLPIIMVTASGSDDNKKAAYTANPNLAGYVVKPYNPLDLVALVKSHLK
jgi:two-component system, chemotaxis family, chemotaxis protein CheY